jgi:hypothetical protein
MPVAVVTSPSLACIAAVREVLLKRGKATFLHADDRFQENNNKNR